MDIDNSGGESVIYLTPEEVNDLFVGISINRQGEDFDLSITPPPTEDYECEYYDDTLKALKEACRLIKNMEKGSIPEKQKAEKVWNTYRFYKLQQWRYTE